MGFFDFLKKRSTGELIGSPIDGEAIESAKIKDPTFSEEMLGKGMAVQPLDGKVYAPVNGSVAMVFDTKHAISIVSEGGAELLIHIGLDTVSLKGEPFTIHVKADDQVKKGDLIAEVDLEMIKAAGLETTTPVIICNSDEYKEVKRFTGKTVKHGDDIMELVKES